MLFLLVVPVRSIEGATPNSAQNPTCDVHVLLFGLQTGPYEFQPPGHQVQRPLVLQERTPVAGHCIFEFADQSVGMALFGFSCSSQEPPDSEGERKRLDPDGGQEDPQELNEFCHGVIPSMKMHMAAVDVMNNRRDRMKRNLSIPLNSSTATSYQKWSKRAFLP